MTLQVPAPPADAFVQVRFNEEDLAVGRRERGSEIRRLRARDRGLRARVELASVAPRPAETPLWFDPSLRTAAELLAERAAGAGNRHVA